MSATLVLAHGAGAGIEHPFMVTFGEYLSARGIDVVTFNFPYMEAGRRLPDPAATLEACYVRVLAELRHHAGVGRQPLFAGGKSLGGRIATHVAAQHADRVASLRGIVCLGYPLHPPGRPERRRDVHLAAIRVPMLVVQGSRDPFGSPDELRPLLAALPSSADLVVVEEGDHSFGVPKRMGLARGDVLAGAADAIASWIGSRLDPAGKDRPSGR